jgi:hypothetical protein
MSDETERSLVRLKIPNHDGVVNRTTNNLAQIRVEKGTENSFLMSFETSLKSGVRSQSSSFSWLFDFKSTLTSGIAGSFSFVCLRNSRLHHLFKFKIIEFEFDY